MFTIIIIIITIMGIIMSLDDGANMLICLLLNDKHFLRGREGAKNIKKAACRTLTPTHVASWKLEVATN